MSAEHYLNNNYQHIKKLKIDIGSGINPKNGFIGIDNFVGIKSQTIKPEDVDISKISVIRHDLNTGIPFETNSVHEVVASHFLEHVINLEYLLEEVHRVLQDGHMFEIFVPYANSAEGMYPGHNIFFTEKWFLNNITFNKLFDIKKIIFYESDYYQKHKRAINKVFTFDQARLFLFNCCWQMQIICSKKPDDASWSNHIHDIEYQVVSYDGPIVRDMKRISNKFPRVKKYIKALLRH